MIWTTNVVYNFCFGFIWKFCLIYPERLSKSNLTTKLHLWSSFSYGHVLPVNMDISYALAADYNLLLDGHLLRVF